MMRAAAFLSCVACAGACAPGEELPPIVWSGEHLDFAPVVGGDELCAGTLPYMDRYLGLAGDAFDLSVGRTVYVLDPEGEVNPCDAYACVLGGTIYTRRTPHEHELIHAARTRSGYRFFEEGAAQAFGDDDEVNAGRNFADGPLRQGIESCADESLKDPWYPRAGHFFSYLHRYHGPDVTSALFQNAPVGVSADEAIAVLESATAMSFDELVADYEDTERFCDLSRWYRYPLFPCDAPEALRPRCDGEVAIPIEISLGCDAATAIGPRDDKVFGYVAIDIPAEGYYRIEGVPSYAGHRGSVEFKECALGCASQSFARSYRELDAEIWLRAGRYSLRFTRKVDATALSTMSITIAGDDCR
ncbi:hypothetical protein [Paraliomyxa miuraensis]|uniref:hypothetical protein n=1 Tax=Paraliomyxa miuraensis TaxID=376150 RepID=UPI002252BDE5|nr:hypothetical protein [Paraliomyxa miuraensis]MCX4242964.1 hypothetical protein [Paraliomyxa miuraensis]